MISTVNKLKDETYVVFDLETTGLDPKCGHSMTEIGAVKIKDGIIIDRFDELINPGILLDDNIVQITGITNEMLKNKRKEEEVLKDFIKWCGDSIFVAHNARFDMSFIDMAYVKYNLGKFNNYVIDTLGISRFLNPEWKNHKLSELVIKYEIPWDEDKHHRADYDSEGTALILVKMLDKLDIKNIKTIGDLSRFYTIVLRKKIG